MRQLFRIFICFLCASVATQAEDVLRPGTAGAGASSAENEPDGRQWHAGVEAGLTFNMFSEDLSGLVDRSVYAPLDSKSGIAPYFSVYVDIPAPFSDDLDFRVKLAYDQKDFSNDGRGVSECDVAGLGFVEMAVDSEFERTITYLDLGLAINWRVAENIYILAGPVLQFAGGDIESTVTQTIVAPEECAWDTNENGILDSEDLQTRTLVIEEPATEGFRFGLEFGAGYSIPLIAGIELTPAVMYQLMLTAPLEDRVSIDDSRTILTGLPPTVLENSALNSLIFTIGLRFGI